MSKPDDLTRIRGIGAATAKALADAGVASFAQLAAIDPKAPPAIEGLPPMADWDCWLEEAAKLLPAATTPAEPEKQAEPAPAPAASEPKPAQGKAAKKASTGKQAGKPAAKAPGEACLVVTGPKQGRRRAGRTFGRDPVRIPLSELGKGERKAIEADPRLTATVEGGANG